MYPMFETRVQQLKDGSVAQVLCRDPDGQSLTIVWESPKLDDGDAAYEAAHAAIRGAIERLFLPDGAAA
jgi:hypothetical protein